MSEMQMNLSDLIDRLIFIRTRKSKIDADVLCNGKRVLDAYYRPEQGIIEITTEPGRTRHPVKKFLLKIRPPRFRIVRDWDYEEY